MPKSNGNSEKPSNGLAENATNQRKRQILTAKDVTCPIIALSFFAKCMRNHRGRLIFLKKSILVLDFNIDQYGYQSSY